MLIKVITIIPTGDKAGCVLATREQEVPVLRDQQEQLPRWGPRGLLKRVERKSIVLAKVKKICLSEHFQYSENGIRKSQEILSIYNISIKFPFI